MTLWYRLQAASEAETQDNRTEQERLRGKKLRYGEVIQVEKSIARTLNLFL